MKQSARAISEWFTTRCLSLYLLAQTTLDRFEKPVAISGGFVMLFCGLFLMNQAYAQNMDDNPEYRIIGGLCNVFWLVEGSYGALIMSVAGLVAIVSAAMGAYKTSMNILVVAIGAFAIRPVIMMFFGTDFGCERGSPTQKPV